MDQDHSSICHAWQMEQRKPPLLLLSSSSSSCIPRGRGCEHPHNGAHNLFVKAASFHSRRTRHTVSWSSPPVRKGKQSAKVPGHPRNHVFCVRQSACGISPKPVHLEDSADGQNLLKLMQAVEMTDEGHGFSESTCALGIFGHMQIVL